MASSRKHTFTPEMVELARAYAADPRKTKAAVMFKLKISHRPLQRLLEQNNIEWVDHGSFREAFANEVRRLAADPKMTKMEAAKQLGTSQSTLQRTLKELKIRWEQSYSTKPPKPQRYQQPSLSSRKHQSHTTPANLDSQNIPEYVLTRVCGGYSYSCEKFNLKGWIAADTEEEARSLIEGHLISIKCRRDRAYRVPASLSNLIKNMNL